MAHHPTALTLEAQVECAKSGDRQALNAVITAVQGMVYRLAVRILWSPADAKDATQEILIRITTHLSQFEAKSKFTTWVYRIASRYLLKVKKSQLEESNLSFTAFAEDLARGLDMQAEGRPFDPEREVLIEEVKTGCTLGMLLCLDRTSRLCYILGEILQFSSAEIADILEISPDTARKRLERARTDVTAFTQQNCGIVAPHNPCRCHRRLETAINCGRVQPARLHFAARAGAATPNYVAVQTEIAKIADLQKAAYLFRTQVIANTPDLAIELFKGLLSEGY